ncbi:ComF family protein [Alicyclobacillus acidocaldarius]|uniref:ComF family protein n=1 Tax=Alicyclobacillus acidocaldarius (strain Tc-4-1) TaxID=1048834 RepID=F8IK46_ALIAT|nr:phosphoribosyltransferase family protein [Alicyclobacillus acidocaldarius]AEJ44752.1 ComF family protein [Alicyclobacillus acidocaldarius subsp. acidocaldarius Tc-4-1]
MPRAYTPSFLVQRFVRQTLNWIFPSNDELCPVCSRLIPPEFAESRPGKRGAMGRLCAFCQQNLALVPIRVQHTRLRAAGRPMMVASALVYDHFVRTLIRAYKYDRVVEIAPFFTSALAATRGAHPPADVVVPVPTAPDRLRMRGYDHVLLVASSFARAEGLPCARALARLGTSGHTRSQTSKDKSRRLRELAGQFVAADLSAIRGRRVLLVDDVMTTGATLVTCAQALYGAGAGAVHAVVMARVE